ncbi:hypothetical protein PO002_38705, partial [Cupriavidus necator]|uniref:hypothetical protein n=1 Tax=Cupriavidus necator TaxID=106590 RepID=UPI0039C3A6CD
MDLFDAGGGREVGQARELVLDLLPSMSIGLSSSFGASQTKSSYVRRSLKPSVVRASDVTSDHLLSAGAWPASSCMRITPE